MPFQQKHGISVLFSSLQLELHSREKSVTSIKYFLAYVAKLRKQSDPVQLREVMFIIKFEYSWFHSPLTFLKVVDGNRVNSYTGGEPTHGVVRDVLPLACEQYLAWAGQHVQTAPRSYWFERQ